MKKTTCITILLLSVILSINAQQYTQPVYAVRKDSAVIFGDETPLNYSGNPFTLKMNIYKPVGDGNTQRPVVICMHGGAFTSDYDFNEYNMNVMATEFARRGYVAVSIDYREGHHIFPYGTGLPQFKDLASAIGYQAIAGTTDWTIPARFYITDSAEAVRAGYRAQQDLKAAIRKMKQRRLTDSSSPCRVFLAGHSAGAISALAAGLIDLDSERPAVTSAIATAPNPLWRDRCEWQVTNPFWPFNQICLASQLYGPAGKDNAAYITHNPAPFNYNAASCYLRPDLGPVDGTVNLSGGENTRIMGIAAFCGAIGDTNIFNGNTYPAIFMYHQPADRIVPYYKGRPFSFLGEFLTPAPNSKWPVLYGSRWINDKLNSINYPGAHVLWTYDNSSNDPFGLNTHDMLPSLWVLTDSVARFFSRVMDTSTQCTTNGNLKYAEIRSPNFESGNKKVQFFPNPVTNMLTVALPDGLTRENVRVTITNSSGKLMMKTNSRNNIQVQLNCAGLLPGIYFVNVSGGNVIVTEKIVKAE